MAYDITSYVLETGQYKAPYTLIEDLVNGFVYIGYIDTVAGPQYLNTVDKVRLSDGVVVASITIIQYNLYFFQSGLSAFDGTYLYFVIAQSGGDSTLIRIPIDTFTFTWGGSNQRQIPLGSAGRILAMVIDPSNNYLYFYLGKTVNSVYKLNLAQWTDPTTSLDLNEYEGELTDDWRNAFMMFDATGEFLYVSTLTYDYPNPSVPHLIKITASSFTEHSRLSGLSDDYNCEIHCLDYVNNMLYIVSGDLYNPNCKLIKVDLVTFTISDSVLLTDTYWALKQIDTNTGIIYGTIYTILDEQSIVAIDSTDFSLIDTIIDYGIAGNVGIVLSFIHESNYVYFVVMGETLYQSDLVRIGIQSVIDPPVDPGNLRLFLSPDGGNWYYSDQLSMPVGDITDINTWGMLKFTQKMATPKYAKIKFGELQDGDQVCLVGLEVHKQHWRRKLPMLVGSKNPLTSAGVSTYASIFNWQTAPNTTLNYASGVVVDDSYVYGCFYSLTDSKIRIFDKNGTYIDEFGSFGTGNGELNTPLGLAQDNKFLYIADAGNHRIQIFNKTTHEYVGQFGSVGSNNGEFDSPTSVAVYGNRLYVCDSNNNRIQIFNKTTYAFIAKFGSSGTGNKQFDYPRSVEVDGNYIYVNDSYNTCIKIFDRSTYKFIAKFGSSGTGDGEFDWVTDLQVDGSYIYVTDPYNYRIQIFNKSTYAFVAKLVNFGVGVGHFRFPYYLDMDDQNLYFSHYYGSSGSKILCFDKDFFLGNDAAIKEQVEKVSALTLKNYFNKEDAFVKGFNSITNAGYTTNGEFEYSDDMQALLLTTDVLQHQTQLVFESSAVAKTQTASTKEFGQLFADGVLVPENMIGVGVFSWKWSAGKNNTIELLNGTTFDANVEYTFTYEELKEVVTNVINIGSQPLHKKIVFDAYVYRKNSNVANKVISVTDKIVFDSAYQADLSYTTNDLNNGYLRHEDGTIIVNWSYVGNKAIKISSSEYKVGKYLFTYDTLMYAVPCEGVEYYHRMYKDGAWTSWSRIYLGDQVEPVYKHQLKVCFRMPITKDEVRLRSLVLKIQSEYFK